MAAPVFGHMTEKRISAVVSASRAKPHLTPSDAGIARHRRTWTHYGPVYGQDRKTRNRAEGGLTDDTTGAIVRGSDASAPRHRTPRTRPADVTQATSLAEGISNDILSLLATVWETPDRRIESDRRSEVESTDV